MSIEKKATLVCLVIAAVMILFAFFSAIFPAHTFGQVPQILRKQQGGTGTSSFQEGIVVASSTGSTGFLEASTSPRTRNLFIENNLTTGNLTATGSNIIFSTINTAGATRCLQVTTGGQLEIATAGCGTGSGGSIDAAASSKWATSTANASAIHPNGGTSILVGIGTTTPSTLFSVHGDALIAGTTTVQSLLATSSVTVNGTTTGIGLILTKAAIIGTTSPSISFGQVQELLTLDAAGVGGGFSIVDGAVRTRCTASGSTGKSYCGSVTASDFVLRTNDVDRVYLASSTGRFGIATDTPGSILSIGNTGDNTINFVASATSTIGNGLNLRNGCFSIRGTCVGGGGGAGTPGGADTQVQFNNAGSFGGSSAFIFLNASGFVGIGTTTPNVHLSVVGTTTTNTLNLGLATSTILVEGRNASTTLRLAAAGALASLANLPIGPIHNGSSTIPDLIDYATVDFPTSIDSCAAWNFTMSNWNGGVVAGRVFWTATSSSGGVTFGFRQLSLRGGDLITNLLGATTTVDDTFTKANDVHVTSFTTNYLPTNASTTANPADDTFHTLKVCRDVRNANDTLDAHARLLQVELKYEKAKFSD